MEGLVQVLDQVGDILTAHTHPNESFGDLVAAPPGTAFGGGVDTSETGCFKNQLTTAQKALGRLSIGKFEADERAEVIHLAGCNFMCRVGRQARVPDISDPGLPEQDTRRVR